ncbi:MAG: hypothetical protein F6J97_21235 [Leptolyngbya sp. SIO4C1]|nr:hypothetical protein [Leptolyngbya sp. SIO4C1]
MSRQFAQSLLVIGAACASLMVGAEAARAGSAGVTFSAHVPVLCSVEVAEHGEGVTVECNQAQQAEMVAVAVSETADAARNEAEAQTVVTVTAR